MESYNSSQTSRRGKRFSPLQRLLTLRLKTTKAVTDASCFSAERGDFRQAAHSPHAHISHEQRRTREELASCKLGHICPAFQTHFPWSGDEARRGRRNSTWPHGESLSCWIARKARWVDSWLLLSYFVPVLLKGDAWFNLDSCLPHLEMC